MKREFDPEKDGDLNREDSGAEKKRTTKTASSEENASASFVRDKRPRIRRVTEELNERVPRERRPRSVQEDSGSAEGRSPERRPERLSEEGREENRRRSYNPNFDEENRRRSPYANDSRSPRSEGNRGRFDNDNRGNRRENDRSEEEDRFNSYRYDREQRPQGGNYRDRQPGRGERDNRYTRNNDRGDNRGYNRNDRDSRPGRDNRSADPRRNSRPGQGTQKGFNVFKIPKGGYDSEYQPKVYPTYAAATINEPIRLNKYISMSGLSSRREADEFIKNGEITVNGKVVSELGVKIDPNDEVRHNGVLLQGEKRVYILMNKPKGFVTTVEDPNAEKTVMDIVRNACRERVYPVGRLDKNSLGVLLITNDGELTKKLTHPSHEKKKVYQVALDRAASAEDLEKLYDGIQLDDGVAVADEVSFLDDTRREVGIVIHSGRNRIVRRMFEELGYHVQKLDRVYFAGLTKKGLRRGAWRYLTPKEVAMLKAGSYE